MDGLKKYNDEQLIKEKLMLKILLTQEYVQHVLIKKIIIYYMEVLKILCYMKMTCMNAS